MKIIFHLIKQGVLKVELNDKIRHRYDRASLLYDFFEQPMELMGLRKWRIDIAKELKGKVLEVGVGTGKNIEYYPEGADITAIDFSGKMLEKARNRAVKYNKKVDLLLMDAQNMDFPDNSFDMVFTTCVFCSVPDPVKGLMEIRRICKPDGKIIMLEHVRSEHKLIGAFMDFVNPMIVNLYGANINRRTIDNINLAGFTETSVTNLLGDIVKKIEIDNIK
jgi:ubiquinone/menaquinone biosynthesis C-methylase UbiE